MKNIFWSEVIHVVVGLAGSCHLALEVRVIHVVVGLARSFHLALVVRVIQVVVGLARGWMRNGYQQFLP